jgi:uncharacterized protein Usg
LKTHIFLANLPIPCGKLSRARRRFRCAGGYLDLGGRLMSQRFQGLETMLRIPDWRLTTAELLYHLPDHPHVLQSFIWQKLDRAPDFPELDRFLNFWQREIEGPIHSVRVASAALTRPAELRYANGVFTLH